MNNITETIVGILFIVLALIGVLALLGLVFSILWNWIVVYMFGLPNMSWYMGTGTLILLSFFKSWNINNKND